ncbi:MAG: TIGR03984 family CRISPR-associated protein [Selenomonadaceae bacterium]|nr:TIGR03984 family CRISPR-associated protein [Selenomonadaceae bacterium]
MSGLDLAKKVGFDLCECKTSSEQINRPARELAQVLLETFKERGGVFVAWQMQNIVWGKFDGGRLVLKDNLAPNVDDWLECRLFNEQEELHLKRDGENFIGRYVHDEAGAGTAYVDSFARLWGERVAFADGWIRLLDAPRKISMELPCDDCDKKFYGLKTRNYIGSDKDTGLSGYIDYRFVAIESAWDGD